jgi:hypothetical protein
MLGIDENVPAGYQRVTLDINIISDAPDEILKDLFSEVYSKTPVPATAGQACKLESVFKVHGKTIATA